MNLRIFSNWYLENLSQRNLEMYITDFLKIKKSVHLIWKLGMLKQKIFWIDKQNFNPWNIFKIIHLNIIHLSFRMCGIDMQSQLAYDLAAKGPIRPADSKIPIVYGMKCIDFVGPEFTLGVYYLNLCYEALFNLGYGNK